MNDGLPRLNPNDSGNEVPGGGLQARRRALSTTE